jgi:glycosyltransferase involved in cell wall biosynthesis
LVRIFANKSPLGIRDNFLNAARHCRAEVVAFCDQDDAWLPNKISVLEAVFKDSCVILAVHSAYLAGPDLVKTGRRFPAYTKNVKLAALTTEPFFSAWGFSMAFRKSLLPVVDHLLASIGPREGIDRLYHDSWIHTIAPILGSTVLLKDNLAIYRQHAQNVIGAPRPAGRNFRSSDQLYKEILEKHKYSLFLSECFSIISAGDFFEFSYKAYCGSVYWQKASCMFGKRAEFYRNTNTLAELAAIFLRLFLSRSYRSRLRGGLGITSMVRDLLHIGGALRGSIHYKTKKSYKKHES